MFEGDAATDINSKLSWNNAELLDYAALTGETVKVKATGSIHTILAQDRVSVQLDCTALLAGAKSNVTWATRGINHEGEIGKLSEIPRHFSGRNSLARSTLRGHLQTKIFTLNVIVTLKGGGIFGNEHDVNF